MGNSKEKAYSSRTRPRRLPEDVSMTTEIIFVVEDSPEGGYEARALGHAIFTQADSLAELRTMVREAVQCHFETVDLPKVIRLHFVREEILAA